VLEDKHRMKKSWAILLPILFVAGVVISPAWHGSHCGRSLPVAAPGHSHTDGDEGCPRAPAEPHHGPDNCSICHLSTTPLLTAPALAGIAFERVGIVICAAPCDVPRVRGGCTLPFSRGPPA
jgi:hypothetical protein